MLQLWIQIIAGLLAIFAGVVYMLARDRLDPEVVHLAAGCWSAGYGLIAASAVPEAPVPAAIYAVFCAVSIWIWWRTRNRRRRRRCWKHLGDKSRALIAKLVDSMKERAVPQPA